MRKSCRGLKDALHGFLYTTKLILTKKKPWSPDLISLHCALHKEYVVIKYFNRDKYELL